MRFNEICLFFWIWWCRLLAAFTKHLFFLLYKLYSSSVFCSLLQQYNSIYRGGRLSLLSLWKTLVRPIWNGYYVVFVYFFCKIPLGWKVWKFVEWNSHFLQLFFQPKTQHLKKVQRGWEMLKNKNCKNWLPCLIGGFWTCFH